VAEPVTETGDDLRIRIHQYLRRHPLMTLYGLSRALRVSETRVRRLLPKMEKDGELAREVTPKTAVTSGPVTRWRAT